MTTGLQVFNGSGVCTFDSNNAAGGVCLGFYTVPATTGVTWTFPAFAGATGGIALLSGGGYGDLTYTVDVALGYPRFIFPVLSAGYEVALFIL